MTASGWHRKRTNTSAEAQRRREYDTPEYRAIRRALKAEHTAGRAQCWRCSRHIPPFMPRHTGHDDHDRSIVRGNECVDCNLGAAARKGAKVANGRRHARRVFRRQGVTQVRL